METNEPTGPNNEPPTQVIRLEAAMVVMTPYALARSSHHLFSMATAYAPDRNDGLLIRMYVFGVAIELGLKAAILGEDCTPANKEMLKQIGHDLEKLNEQFELTFEFSLFDAEDLDAFQKMNPHFKQKGLEYFTLPVLGLMLNGYEELPSLEAIEAVAAKVHGFLESRNFVLDGKTSQPPSGGILNFV